MQGRLLKMFCICPIPSTKIHLNSFDELETVYLRVVKKKYNMQKGRSFLNAENEARFTQKDCKGLQAKDR